jgi:hypothetical protein
MFGLFTDPQIKAERTLADDRAEIFRRINSYLCERANQVALGLAHLEGGHTPPAAKRCCGPRAWRKKKMDKTLPRASALALAMMFLVHTAQFSGPEYPGNAAAADPG